MASILTFYLAFYLTFLLTFYLAFYLTYILTIYLTFILTSYLAFHLPYILTFYLGFRSGGDHCDLELAVEVRWRKEGKKEGRQEGRSRAGIKSDNLTAGESLAPKNVYMVVSINGGTPIAGWFI